MKNKMRMILIACLCVVFSFTGCAVSKVEKTGGNSVPSYEEMSKSVYAYDSSKKDYESKDAGLKNPYIVGVDSAKFDNEVRYAIPQDNVIVIDTTAHEFGAKADDGKDDALAIQKAINKAKTLEEAKTKIIKLPKGRVDILEGKNGVDYEYGLVIDGIKNLVIDGNGAEIMISCFLGMSGFFINNCENLLLTNFTVDYTIPPYVMGKVTSFDKQTKTIIVKINKGYEQAIDLNAPIIQYVEYDAIAKTPKAPGNYLYVNDSGRTIKSSEYIKNSDNSYSVKLIATDEVSLYDTMINTPIALGSTFYVAQLFLVENNKNIKFESIDAYSAWGMTVRAYNNENVYFNSFNCICKPNTDRLFTASADILHLKNTKGEIIISNCQLENSHDDAINIGGHMLKLSKLDGANKSVTAIYDSGMWGTFRPEIGEVFELTDSANFELLTTLTVKTSTYTKDGYVLTFEETEKASIDEKYFDFTKITSNHKLSSVSRAPKVVIENNIVRNKRNRGMLIQTRDVIIQNNVFSNIVHGAIMLLADDVQFHESLTPRDINVRNNKFFKNSVGQAYGDIDMFAWVPSGTPAAGVIRDMSFENNFFANSYNACMSFRSCSDMNIANNTFYNPAINNLTPEANACMLITKSDRLTFTKNKVVADADPEFKSIIVSGKLPSTAIKLVDNDGLVMEEGKIIPAIEITKQTHSPIIDGELTEWDSIDSLVKINSATLGAAKIELSSIEVFDFSQVAKVTYDDNGLYFAFKVVDDNINFLPSWWNGDFIEIFISNNTTSEDSISSFPTLKPNEDFAQIFMSDNKVDVFDNRTSASIKSGKNLITSSFKLTSDGYQGEIFMPFSIMPKIAENLKAGNEISLSITFGECDDTSSVTITRLSNVNFPIEENKQSPAAMGKIKAKANA